MASSRSSNWVPIVVALIGLAGVIAAAVISRDGTNSPEHRSTAATAAQAEPVSATEQPSPVAITGVLIGRTGDQPFVSDVITQFGPKEEMAITVRYTASEEVSNFPVRLSARVFSGMGNGVEEQVSDVSVPGNSFWTFRFKPKDGWFSSQQFVSIEVDGRKAYSQAVNIKNQ